MVALDLPDLLGTTLTFPSSFSDSARKDVKAPQVVAEAVKAPKVSGVL